jgi:EmrB/QacA subfamily drug resistance transporter
MSPVPELVHLGTAAGRWVLLATVLGSSLALLDATVVNVALPAIGGDLDADVADLQWTLSGYLLALASLILLAGSLSDRYGRRRVFVAGVAWFAGGSLLCAVAPTVEVLIGARILQGVGGALLTPGSLAILQASFGPGDRARAIGAWSGLGGIAAAVGPFVGGYLVDAVSWRAIFLLNLPLAALVIIVALRHVPESRDPTATGRFDVPGAALGAVALAAGTFALIEAPGRGLGSPEVLLSGLLGPACAVAFVLVEAHTRSPLLPLGIFSSHQFTSANLVTFAVYAALGGAFFLLVLQLQQVLRYSPLEAGVAALPVTVILLALSSRAGELAQRIGPRAPLTAGPLLIAVGLLLMTRIDEGANYVSAVLPAVIVFGFGLVLTVAPVTATVLAAADERHAGVASGVNNAVARIGGLLAVAVLPLIAGIGGDDYRDPDAFSGGFRTAMLVAAGLAAVGGIVALLTIRDDVLEGEQDPAGHQSHCAIDGPPLRNKVAPEHTQV